MLFLIFIFIVYVIIRALPLYLCVNLVLWLFDLSFRLTIFQAIGVSVLISLLLNFYGKGDKNV